MPRILRIVNRFNLGGPTYNAAYLSKYLPDSFETLLVGGSRESDEESSEFILRNLGIDYQILPDMHRSINPGKDRQTYLQLLKLIKEFQPDIIHTHASKAGAIGRLAAKASNTNVVVHTFHGHVFHSYFGNFKTSIFKTIERRLAASSSAIIAISDLQKHELCEVHKVAEASKTHVIKLGFDLDRFLPATLSERSEARTRFNLRNDSYVVGIIGRLAPVKNHALFIQAFQLAQTAFPGKMQAMVVGDGQLLGALIVQCHEAGLTTSLPDSPNPEADVVFCSWVRNIEEALPAMDLVALTSFNEGTPVSLIEAQSAGLPVIATGVGGVKDIVPACTHPFISNDFSPQSLSSGIINLANDRALSKELAEQGRKFALSHFHYSRMVYEHAQLYEQLLSI